MQSYSINPIITCLTSGCLFTHRYTSY